MRGITFCIFLPSQLLFSLCWGHLPTLAVLEALVNTARGKGHRMGWSGRAQTPAVSISHTRSRYPRGPLKQQQLGRAATYIASPPSNELVLVPIHLLWNIQ